MKDIQPSGHGLLGRHRWLVTGAAGFIGSHVTGRLLALGQEVVGLDNLSTGRVENLDGGQRRVSSSQWEAFRLIEGDVRDHATCVAACDGVDHVLHEAALVSVPVSIEQPQATHDANAGGWLNVLEAARQCGVRSVVYASSSAVYGDLIECPVSEGHRLAPLSPYGASKAVDEVYAGTWERCYGLQSVGLRYFNVFGPRQDPNGAYAAVIPKWIEALLREQPIRIFGDGSTTRDFCHVTDVVQANIRAALWKAPEGAPRVFNVGLGHQTRLDDLLNLLDKLTAPHRASQRKVTPIHEPFRAGDPRVSCAEITSLVEHLGFAPTMSFEDGLRETVEWFVGRLREGERGPGIGRQRELHR